MQFYSSQTPTDCACAAIEFLLQKRRHDFADKLVWDRYAGYDTHFCSWQSLANFKGFNAYRGLQNKGSRRIFIVQWDHNKESSHTVLVRGQSVYDPWLKRKFKNLDHYRKVTNNPKVIWTVSYK